MKLKVIIIICSLFFSITSEANTKNNYNVERVKYIKALKYFKKKNFREFENLKKELVHYPLYANLEYKSLHRKRNINDDDVIKFIQKYKKSYLSEKAYINLIYRLSRKNLSKKLVLNYQDIGSVELHCLYLRAKIKQKLLSNIEEEIIPIWLNAKSQPKSCTSISNCGTA